MIMNDNGYIFSGEMGYYTITLYDGTEIKDVIVNGDYFVTLNKVTDEMLSNDNLIEVTIKQGRDKEVRYNLRNYDLHKFEGKYWFIIREPDAEELKFEAINAKIDYIAMMGGLDL